MTVGVKGLKIGKVSNCSPSGIDKFRFKHSQDGDSERRTSWHQQIIIYFNSQGGAKLSVSAKRRLVVEIFYTNM